MHCQNDEIMEQVYLVRKITRRFEERYETIEVFDNLKSAIKWYNHTIEYLKKIGGILYDFNNWGYKENIDFEITEDKNTYHFFVYTFNYNYETSVFIKTKILRK